MVDFDIPTPFTPSMSHTLVKQRERVSELFFEGKIISYCVNSERTKLWVIVVCETEFELLDLIVSLPMTKFMSYHYDEIMFLEMAAVIPDMSLN